MKDEDTETSVIPEIPDIQPGIHDAALQGKLIIFIGAGLSQILGAPSWEGFAKRLFGQLTDAGCLSYNIVDQLKDLGPKQQISIAMDVCKEQSFKPDFQKILSPNKEVSDEISIYENLYSIGTPCVTTNYDEYLDDLAESYRTSPDVIELEPKEKEVTSISSYPVSTGKIFYRKADFTVEKLCEPGNVLHLHGSVKEPRTMVLTTRDYLTLYTDGDVETFLQRLFNEYTVLFVGYNLEDEILEHIFRQMKPKSDVSHYWLFRTYSHNFEKYEHLKRYYAEHFGVQLVGFCTDTGGDNQIKIVVEQWAKTLRGIYQKPGFIDVRMIIDEALDE
jgi:hypothetical protein